MNNIENRHFGYTRTLLLAIGLWPYQKSPLVRIQSFFFFTVLTTSIVFQLTTFVTSRFSPNLVTKVLAFTFPYIGLAVAYNSFCINRETIILAMEQVQHVCDNLKNNEERAIIERYRKNAKRYMNRLITFYVCCLFMILIAQLWPQFLNIVLSVNISRPRHLPIVVEYFVNEEKYFYLLLLHFNAAGAIGVIALLALGSMLIVYFQDACAMFQIASYRIEKAMNILVLNGTSILNVKLSYEGLTYAVDIHRTAMIFDISFIFLVVLGVLTLSLNIFRIFQVVLSEYNTGEFLIHLGSASVAIIYMFLTNFMGQKVIDHNNNVYATAYKVRWYKAPLYVQRFILFLLQRSSKSFDMKIGGLFVASIQCFATLTNTSISYFTVMYSTR